MSHLQVCYLPAQWRALDPAHVRDATCAVIDVIRGTSTLLVALENGATGVRPVRGVDEARAWKEQHPDVILAGERGGLALPGFDRGNSPREMTREAVGGKELVLTTTNGTQALAACTGAKEIVTASFLNLDAVAARLLANGPPWIVVCAGYEGHFGMDDALVGGALSEALGHAATPFASLYRSARGNLAETLLGSWAGQELLKVGLEADVALCAELNRSTVVPVLDASGVLRAFRAA